MIVKTSQVEGNSQAGTTFQAEKIISRTVELDGLFNVLERNNESLRLINHQLNLKCENLDSIRKQRAQEAEDVVHILTFR